MGVFKSLKNLNWNDDGIVDYNDMLFQDKMMELNMIQTMQKNINDINQFTKTLKNVKTLMN